jgi:hypothetical protein
MTRWQLQHNDDSHVVNHNGCVNDPDDSHPNSNNGGCKWLHRPTWRRFSELVRATAMAMAGRAQTVDTLSCTVE